MMPHRIAVALVVAVIGLGRIAHGAPQRPIPLLDAPGFVADYGQRERNCDEPLAMSLPADGHTGDYAMCCRELLTPIALFPDEVVEIRVRLRHAEDRFQAKLEDASSHLFIRDGHVDAGESVLRRSFSRTQRKPWQIQKICVASAGHIVGNDIEVLSAWIVGPQSAAAPAPAVAAAPAAAHASAPAAAPAAAAAGPSSAATSRRTTAPGLVPAPAGSGAGDAATTSMVRGVAAAVIVVGIAALVVLTRVVVVARRRRRGSEPAAIPTAAPSAMRRKGCLRHRITSHDSSTEPRKPPQ